MPASFDGDPIVTSDQVRICACGVIVLAYAWGDGSTFLWDPTPLQRRWVRSLWPRPVLSSHGFGWEDGAQHKCCPPGTRPVDVLAVWRARQEKGTPPRGMGLAGDGTYEGPGGQGGGL